MSSRKQVTGVDRLNAKFRALPDGAQREMLRAAVRGADELRRAQQSLAPVSTGALRDSIEVTLPGDWTPAYSAPGGDFRVPEYAVMVTVGNADVRYAHLVEYGTSDTTAQPFFWPAYRLHRKRIKSRVSRAGARAARRIAARR